MENKWDISAKESYMSNVSMKPFSPSHHYTCDIHSIFFGQHLCPTRSIRKRCVDCLKKNVYANVAKNQIVLNEYNYIFPMLCDVCAIKLQKCKWCRPTNCHYFSNH